MLVLPACIYTCNKHTKIVPLCCLALWHPNKSLSLGSLQLKLAFPMGDVKVQGQETSTVIIHLNEIFMYYIRCCAGISAVIRLYN